MMAELYSMTDLVDEFYEIERELWVQENSSAYTGNVACLERRMKTRRARGWMDISFL